MKTISFEPTKKEPVFKLHISNHDENIQVNKHHEYYGGATRFGTLLTPKNPLDMDEMCKWLEEQGMPTYIKDCSKFGTTHPNGVFIFDEQTNNIDGHDYIYFVDVNFVSKDNTGINYPEVDIKGYEFPSY